MNFKTLVLAPFAILFAVVSIVAIAAISSRQTTDLALGLKFDEQGPIILNGETQTRDLMSSGFFCTYVASSNQYSCPIQFPTGIEIVENSLRKMWTNTTTQIENPWGKDVYSPEDGEVCSAWTWVSGSGSISLSDTLKGPVMYLVMSCQNGTVNSILNFVGVVTEGGYAASTS